MLILGDLRLSTTDAGYGGTAAGDGLQGRIGGVRGMRRHWSHGGAAGDGALVSDLGSVLVEASAGARWASVSHSSPGITRAGFTSATLTSGTRGSPISTASRTITSAMAAGHLFTEEEGLGCRGSRLRTTH